MELFLDTAEVSEVREVAAWGLLDGVTTNPTLIQRSGRDFLEVVREIAEICPGPISAEVTATESAGMIEQGRALKAALPSNVIIKVPCTVEGMKATRALADEGIGVNVTLVFNASQALLSAKAGARYVSPFVGRLDDVGQDGMILIEEIMTTWGHYPEIEAGTRVLAASLRHPAHVLACMQLGVHTATLPFKVFKQLLGHPLTDKGLDAFLADWAEVEAAGRG